MFLLLVLIIITGLLLASNALNFTVPPEDVKEAFAGTGYQPQHQFLKLNEGKLHYITVGDSSLRPVLLIHGPPGTWDNYVALVSKTGFLDNYFAIIPDRPGYGKTTLSPWQDLGRQADYFAQLLHLHGRHSKAVVLGHSYGAAVALTLAAEHSHKVGAVVSVAGTIAYPHQPWRWYNYVVKYSPVKYLIKDELVTSNEEMWKLTGQLEKLEQQLDGFTGRAAFISGAVIYWLIKNPLPT